MLSGHKRKTSNDVRGDFHELNGKWNIHQTDVLETGWSEEKTINDRNQRKARKS
jgi:hypothetical protein